MDMHPGSPDDLRVDYSGVAVDNANVQLLIGITMTITATITATTAYYYYFFHDLVLFL
jgi:hypothetical protein